jgi:hypothetical protein
LHKHPMDSKQDTDFYGFSSCLCTFDRKDSGARSPEMK